MSATVVVTGAGSGIGLACAEVFSEAGHHVALIDRDRESLTHVQKELRERGASVSVHPADVTVSSEIDAVITEIEAAAGPIATLVNSAGILRMNEVTELSDSDWDAMFAVNAAGVFHVSRAVVRVMLPRRSGCIVTVASNAAGTPRISMAGYAASKAASAMFTKCLGLEVAGRGIRCNVVSPGSTDTPMQRAMWTGDDPVASARRVIDGDSPAFKTGIPLGRIADPRDIADAVAFLASDAARHITMHDLYVDGGATLG